MGGQCSRTHISLKATARVAQSVERTALNRMVVGSTPTLGAFFFLPSFQDGWFDERVGPDGVFWKRQQRSL